MGIYAVEVTVPVVTEKTAKVFVKADNAEQAAAIGAAYAPGNVVFVPAGASLGTASGKATRVKNRRVLDNKVVVAQDTAFRTATIRRGVRPSQVI